LSVPHNLEGEEGDPILFRMLFLDGIYIDPRHDNRARFRRVKAPTLAGYELRESLCALSFPGAKSFYLIDVNEVMAHGV